MTKVIDPWGGSYYVETLTDELMEKAWALNRRNRRTWWHGKSD